MQGVEKKRNSISSFMELSQGINQDYIKQGE